MSSAPDLVIGRHFNRFLSFSEIQKSSQQSSAPHHRSQLDIQRLLRPERENLLSSTHRRLLSSNSRSKFQSSFARISRISAYAKLFSRQLPICAVKSNRSRTYFIPMEFLGPTLNGAKAPLSSASYLSFPNHLSGTNESGSLQFAASR